MTKPESGLTKALLPTMWNLKLMLNLKGLQKPRGHRNLLITKGEGYAHDITFSALGHRGH